MKIKRKWAVSLAVFFLVGSIAAERITHTVSRSLRRQRKEMQTRLEDLRIRTLRATEEKQRYDELNAKARLLAEKVSWEADTTNVLRWFADTAAECNVRLTNSKLLPPRRPGDEIVFDAFARTRYSLQMEGGYGALVRYTEAIERCPHVMLIDSFALLANRDDDGTGEMKMSVSALSPLPERTVSFEEATQ